MVAPTARVDIEPASGAATQAPTQVPTQAPSIPDNEQVMIEVTSLTETQTETNNSSEAPAGITLDAEGRPKFASVEVSGQRVKKEVRSIPVPPHRLSPLRQSWNKIYIPLVEHLKLQVKMNVRHKKISLRTCKDTTDVGAIQKGADFLRAFMLGFDIDDAIALLRLDDLYIETFEVKDVKTLNGDHLSRAIGRIAGKDGKTKFAIENASRTRVVLADSKIHILGGFSNIKIARETIVSLIRGAPPGKIYGNLRIISSRMKERY